MKRLILGLAMTSLVMAKPELYREKEDFQYSRSSSDEGTKSGYYDAQRGNMGGNYEKAHNMDTLAQHQMGGLVKQVDGELGDGSNTRTGSVFSSANSRGIYGSGHYDLSNLAGRNFQEGVSYGDSQHASSSNSAYTVHSSSHNNERHSSSGHTGYQASNAQETQNLYDAKQYERGMPTGHSSMHLSQSGYNGQNLYGQRVYTDNLASSNTDSNTHHRLISTVPVKIIVRPGQSIAVPIATQTHSGLPIATNTHSASFYDQNAVNNEAEVSSTNIHQQALQPTNTGKHYESSYRYHKEWEKHDTRPAVIPLAIPTLAPISNSELYDDSYAQRGTQHSEASNRYEQNSDYNSASSQSRYQTDFNARHQSLGSSNSHIQSGTNSNFNSQSANLIGIESSKPKSYQSSYSYHKSWERQGDPYIIKPASNGVYEGQTSGRLTDITAAQNGYSSYNYGSRRTQSQQRYTQNNCMVECEPSHDRVVRSYNSNYDDQFQQQSQNTEDFGQQSQNQWADLTELGQQTQAQLVQTDNFGQTQNKDNLEDFGQQTQDTWDQSESRPEHFENFGQQTQNKDNLENFGQQTQNTWGQTESRPEHLENFGQHAQNKDDLEDFGQQTQDTWSQIENLGQQTQTLWNSDSTGQETENQWGQLDDRGQQTQHDLYTAGQQSQMDYGQQTQDIWGKIVKNEQSKKFESNQQTVNKWYPINTQNVEQPQASTEKNGSNLDNFSNSEQTEQDKSMEHSFQSNDMTQQTSGIWDKIYNQHQSFETNNGAPEFHPNQPQNTGGLSNLWGKLDNLDEGYTQHTTNNENSYFSQSSSSQQFHQNWHKQEIYQHSNSDKDFNEKPFNNAEFESNPLIKQENGTLTTFDIGSNKMKTTTAINNAYKSSTAKTFDNNNKDITTTTEKETNTHVFRPIDIGRGDIGPEESTTDKEIIISHTTDNNYPIDEQISVVSDINKEKITKEIEDLTKENSHYVEKYSVFTGNINKHETEGGKPIDVEEMSPELNKHNINTELIDQQNTQTEFIDQQNTQQELQTFEQNFKQQNQHFIESMQHFETQNNEQSSNFNKQNNDFDQKLNLNLESQNTEQQSVDEFNQQSQQSVQNFDQEFVDFSQQDQKTQKNNKDSEIEELIPEPVNFHEQQLEVRKKGLNNREQDLEQAGQNTYNHDYSVIGMADLKEQEMPKSVVAEPTSTEIVTEKTGFWKSVGNKFTNAKNKVASWFGS
ncbi:unnamed protein product [Diatraea saccharalis]|uniref:Uncharacterized protein n=1 Tax=Diatraea saccharalis TaxID=40085 RepID=A0A9P0C7I1_9NEOP|nr:unnamed protein product [Diatraea saccharalis]